MSPQEVLLLFAIGFVYVFPPEILFARVPWLVRLFLQKFPRHAQDAKQRIREALAVPEEEAHRILVASLHHLAWTALEVLYFLKEGTSWLDRVFLRVEGKEHLPPRGEGHIFLSAHLGNWELAGAWLCRNGYPLLAVEKPQSGRLVAQLLLRLRRKAGIQLLSKELRDFRPLLRALREGVSVGLISDQHAGKRGLPARFFHRRTSTFLGPVLLAYAQKRPIHPIFALREAPGRLFILVLPPLEVPGTPSDPTPGLEAYNRVLEEVIRRYPEQWLWLHRRWRPDEL